MGRSMRKALAPYYKRKSIDLKAAGLLDLYMNEMSRFEVLTIAKEHSLAKSKARNRLVEHNLRLVIFLAKKFQGRGLPLLDLVQEGNLGLIKAAEHFDLRKKCNFGWYAGYWILRAISLALDNYGRTVRVPVHGRTFDRKVWRVSAQLANELGQEATLDELAARLALPVESVTVKLEETNTTALRLNQPLFHSDDGNSSQLVDTIANRSELSPDQYAVAKDELESAVEKINKLCQGLTFRSEQERQIFTLRYGLDGTLMIRKLDEVGRFYAISRQRVDQVLSKVWSRARMTGIERDGAWLAHQVGRASVLSELTGDVVDQAQLSLPVVVPATAPVLCFNDCDKMKPS